VKPRLPRPLRWLEIATLVVAVVFVFAATPRVAGLMGSGAAEFGTSIGELFPSGQGTKPIDLPTSAGTVNSSLPLDFVPDFTREPSLKLTGKVPGFLLGEGRTIEVTVGGTVAATLTPDATGAYSATIALKEGPNPITFRLLAGSDSVATSSYTVVFDKTPPGLLVTKPKASDKIEGETVVVEGKAEAGATVIVNDRTIVPAQDGSFSDTINVAAGPLTITVVARDRAGNETTSKTAVTVAPKATAAPLTVAVSLDRSRVKPGALVDATITVTANGAPRADEQVTLSVGVITIGSAKTNASGTAVIGFFAPPNEGDAAVVVLAAGASGRATLTVAK
jgi:glucodextranase-like protein